ncbi:MAG: C40 family peptidase [Taibaiella sp.]|nr:C40 family peptidase [Taibaiella sp.]
MIFRIAITFAEIHKQTTGFATYILHLYHFFYPAYILWCKKRCVLCQEKCGTETASTWTERQEEKAKICLWGKYTGSDQRKKTSLPAPKYFTHPLSINRDKFVRHARTYLGTPYVYGGTDKKRGLDCSGFIYNVFLHFDILPPRVSKDYTYEGIPVTLEKARPGDIILFTSPGTKKTGTVGHMGIITEPYPNLHFIHSASGNSKGVIVSEFKGYYVEHFVKVISVLK